MIGKSRPGLPESLTRKQVGSDEQWSALVDEAQEFADMAGRSKLEADKLEASGFPGIKAMEKSDRYLQWSIATSLLALNYKP